MVKSDCRFCNVLVCLAAGVVLLPGCGSRGPEPVPLVLISPHRDEIRQEVAAAFRDWFAERTRQRKVHAQDALEAWLKDQGKEQQSATDTAFAQLFADWSAADLGDLLTAVRTWQAQTTVDNGLALDIALAEWKGPQRPTECVWQDIGGGTSQIIRYVEARFGGDRPGIGIDLVFGGGTDTYLRFADRGLLHPLPEVLPLIRGRIRPELNGVPLYDSKARWFGPMLSSFGLLLNREVLRRIGEPDPQTWSDLGRPGLRSWVNAGDPRLTGSVHMVYEIILQGNGWDDGFRLLLRLGANTHTFIRDSGTLTRSATIGEVAVVGNVDVNALGAVNREPAFMTFQLPRVEEVRQPDGTVRQTGGTIINPDAIAVLRGAPHLELARAFVEFTLSDAGQKLFLLRPGQPGGPRQYALCRLSVVEALYKEFPPEVRSVGAADPFTQTNALRYQAERGNKRWDALNDLIGAVIVDVHDDLAAAWQAVLESKLPADERHRLEEELFQPFGTEADLERHARRIIEDGPRTRTMQVNEWSERARERYRRIRRQAGGG